ncbi:hypothetical protein DSO57_1016205 [Entomophthora muscae]|uniref:Uncharacterized protein n=1 Tax=Entomophthora muscae TaxID=34485 RepID=A0ACC2UQ99_9FUNG|nr:hypothetical protein DSO57_1016205 [Entomophthora muscae]
MAHKGVDTGGEKKSKGQKVEAVVPYTVTLKTSPKATIPDEWEDHWEGEADAPSISGEGTKQKAWQEVQQGSLMMRMRANVMSEIEASLSKSQKKQLMMCLQLFAMLLDSYGIDDKCAQV